MKITISLGTRDTLDNFVNSYSENFLKKFGLKTYYIKTFYSLTKVAEEKMYTVATKHDQVVVRKEQVLTYVGDGKWDVKYD